MHKDQTFSPVNSQFAVALPFLWECGHCDFNIWRNNMSNVNYDLNSKGVRMIASEEAWIKAKNGKVILNPKYKFIGKIDVKMPNFIIKATDKGKPTYKGDVSNLNKTAKSQIISYFYDDNGKRNKKSIAYFVISKNKEKK